MMWMTWRQFRPNAIIAAAALAAVALLLAVTGTALASDYASAGLTACHPAACAGDATAFRDGLGAIYPVLFYAGLIVLYAAPALIGMFWGAPLIAREFEAGTHRLAWTQSVTHGRWTAVKLGCVGLAAVTTTGLLSLMITWWASPLDSVAAAGHGGGLARMSPLVFGARGVVPLGYAAAAFALGVTAGALIRRTVPAMALTLAVFAVVQVVLPVAVRPHLMPPVTATRALSFRDVGTIEIGNGAAMTVLAQVSAPGALVVSNRTITPSGQVFTGPATSACIGPSASACARWLASKHLRQQVSYQPASRFWPLQWIETALYLAIAAALGALCVRQVRRRRG